MSLGQELSSRSNAQCELCAHTKNLSVFEVPPVTTGGLDGSIYICETCKQQIEEPDTIDPNHWRCLNDSMWSTVPAVQVMAWRMLNRLANEDWSEALLDMMYLEEDTLKWARATGEAKENADLPKHKDSNGNLLQSGDSVVLIKSLDVKGSSLTAKRGTVVKKISLVEDNHEHIEGKVEGQHIVILTKFVKKSN